jgi:hypothetical protein
MEPSSIRSQDYEKMVLEHLSALNEHAENIIDPSVGDVVHSEPYTQTHETVCNLLIRILLLKSVSQGLRGDHMSVEAWSNILHLTQSFMSCGGSQLDLTL